MGGSGLVVWEGVVSWCGREWSHGVGGVVSWCGREWSRGVEGSGCIGVCIYKEAMLECVTMQHMHAQL